MIYFIKVLNSGDYIELTSTWIVPGFLLLRHMTTKAADSNALVKSTKIHRNSILGYIEEPTGGNSTANSRTTSLVICLAGSWVCDNKTLASNREADSKYESEI